MDQRHCNASDGFCGGELGRTRQTRGSQDQGHAAQSYYTTLARLKMVRGCCVGYSMYEFVRCSTSTPEASKCDPQDRCTVSYYSYQVACQGLAQSQHGSERRFELRILGNERQVCTLSQTLPSQIPTSL